MSNAPQYTPTANFTQDESVNASGRSTVNTTKLDAELANIATSLNGTNTNLQKIQRDDGKLTDYIVEPYNLADRTRTLIAGGWNPRGNFTPGVVYAVRDFVIANGLQYVCLVAHTASASFNSESALWMAASSAIDASIAAAAASASALAAATSEINAASSASNANISATNSASSATAASNSANSAGNSATSAATSATSAAGSATSSASDAAIAVAARQFNTLLIGSDCDWNGVVLPSGTLLKDGSAIPRATYALLLDALAPLISNLTITNGSNQVTGIPSFVVSALGGNGVKSPQIPIEGVGIPAGAKIASISGTTLTLTVNATASDTSARVFVHGNGNGSTTFNLPQGLAEGKRGADMGRGIDSGRYVGSLQGGSIAAHTHGLSSTFVAAGGNQAATSFSTVWGSTSSAGGSETRMRNLAYLPAIWAYVP